MDVIDHLVIQIIQETLNFIKVVRHCRYTLAGSVGTAGQDLRHLRLALPTALASLQEYLWRQ